MLVYLRQPVPPPVASRLAPIACYAANLYACRRVRLCVYLCAYCSAYRRVLWTAQHTVSSVFTAPCPIRSLP